MCGICGYVNKNKNIEMAAIKKMMAVMEHRGPDDEGVYFDNELEPFCALGHRRLSIIDLETGHQPMISDNGRIWCVHNGEIYNYKPLRDNLIMKGYHFRTNSDTEVIVNMYQEYGKDFVKKLNGMFAFCIWDKTDRSLLLVRDRVGIKPLFYYYDGDNFLFSSSLKSFMRLDFVNKEIDPQALSEYLQYLYVNAPKSIFRGIKKLEPGQSLVFKEGKIQLEHYWDMLAMICDTKGNYIKDEKRCIAHIRDILTDALRIRLMSDVPLGLFLSGGVDSSIITAIVSRLTKDRIKTFNVSFRGKGYYNEAKYAKKISRMFRTEHREVAISPDFKKDLNGIVGYLDEPFADSSFVPTYYLSRFTRQFVKVALSGTGGDDIFAGYRRYAVDKAADIFSHSPRIFKKIFSFTTDKIQPGRASRIGETALLARRFLSTLNASEDKRHDMIMSFINRDLQQELLARGSVSKKTEDMVTELFHNFKGEHYINKSLYTDYRSYLSGDLLAKEDKATMAVGLEGRVPFLDHRLVELSFRIDPQLKVRNFTTKYILKKAFEHVLPRDILYREKHGFAFPVNEYLRGPLMDSAKEILFSGIHSMFNVRTIENLFNMHTEKKQNLGQHIWSLVVFNLWYEMNVN